MTEITLETKILGMRPYILVEFDTADDEDDFETGKIIATSGDGQGGSFFDNMSDCADRLEEVVEWIRESLPEPSEESGTDV